MLAEFATAAILATAAPVHSANAVKRWPHHPECHSQRCAHNADEAFNRRHHKRKPSGGTPMVASYFGGGSGACGGGSWGVASKTLACGTRLRICAASCAEATITDRGPYVAGRELDLTEDVALAIGFPMSAGVATVLVTIR